MNSPSTIQAEWKLKDRLHVSFGLCRNLPTGILKNGKSKYLSPIIANSSTATCEMFVSFFTNKVASVRQNVINRPVSPEVMYVLPAKSAVFEQIETTLLRYFAKLVVGMKLITYPWTSFWPSSYWRFITRLDQVYLSLLIPVILFHTISAALKHAVVWPLAEITPYFPIHYV